MNRLILSLLSVFILHFGLGDTSVVAEGVAPDFEVVEGAGAVDGADAEGAVSAVDGADAADAVDAANASNGEGTLTTAQKNAIFWERANAAYFSGNFASAAVLYDSIEMSGMVSARLYYNKAGTMFKMGKIGESILYYSKAQRLAPADKDIAHNLAIAASYTRNHIEPVPEFFSRRWIRQISSLMSGNGWAVMSVALFALALAAALIYLLPLGQGVRKIGFYGSLAAFLLFISALAFAWRSYREATHPTRGVVVSVSAAVKSSPDNSGKDLFLLYEGDRVGVRDELGGWSEITVANGNRGWVRSSAIAMVD